MKTQTTIDTTSRTTRFTSDDGRVGVKVRQRLEWVDESGNVQRGLEEPTIIMQGQRYSAHDALQVLFLLSAALELAQSWAKE